MATEAQAVRLAVRSAHGTPGLSIPRCDPWASLLPLKLSHFSISVFFSVFSSFHCHHKPLFMLFYSHTITIWFFFHWVDVFVQIYLCVECLFTRMTQQHISHLLPVVCSNANCFGLSCFWDVYLWDFLFHSTEKLHLKSSTATYLCRVSVPVILDNPQNKFATVFKGTISYVESRSKENWT